jgi:hypothetical protein
MLKHYSQALAAATFAFLAFSLAPKLQAQCVADHVFGDITLGIYPDQTLGEYLAPAQQNVWFTDTLHLATPTDTDEMDLGLPFNLIIDSLVIAEIELVNTSNDTIPLSDLGLELICNNNGDAPNPCAFLGNSQYCGLLEGTPLQADTFQVLINVTGFATSQFGIQAEQPLAFTNTLIVAPSAVGGGCMDAEACNFDADATTDDGSCTYPDFCFDCADECICDEDNDGVCDPWEFYGCTEELACNYSEVYTEDDGSCFYALPGFDCNGGCLDVVNDACGFAEPIGCGQLVEASTVCADTADVPFCDQFNIGEYSHGGLWYSVIGTGDSMLMTLCFEDTDFDTYLNVFDGVCGGLNCVAGNDDQSEASAFDSPCGENFLASEVQFLSDEGVEYFIHISGSNAVNPAAGGFDFVMVCDSVVVPGCTDLEACNGNPWATIEDGSCEYTSCAGCDIFGACNYDSTAVILDMSLCDFSCYGCMDPAACNFSTEATIESGLCEFISCAGCMDLVACNYDPSSTLESGLCEFITCVGCMDPEASNYDDGATIDNGLCSYCGLVVDSVWVVDPLCYLGENGAVGVQVSGAISDSVWFVLTGISGSVSDSLGAFDGLMAGPFEVEIFDGDSSCSALASMVLVDPLEMELAWTSDSTSCFNSVDGELNLSLVGGEIGDVVFEIIGMENTMTTDGWYVGLASGLYSVQATDMFGCVVQTQVEVLAPDALEISVDLVTGADPGENDGAIAVSITGGTPDYEFVWSAFGETVADVEDLLGIAAGDYDLIVIDANGCTAGLNGTVPLGVHDLTADLSWSVMPNPAQDRLRLDFGDLAFGAVCGVEIFDARGVLIELKQVLGATVLDVSNWPAGMYWLRAVQCNNVSPLRLDAKKVWVLR